MLAKRPEASSSSSDPQLDSGLAGAGKSWGRRGGGDQPLDEKTMQQLRGIFAAHDEDRDLKLTRPQLAEAVRALGFTPTEDLLSKFLGRSASGRNSSLTQQPRGGAGARGHGRPMQHVDLRTFLHVASQELGDAPDVSEDLRELFSVFDEHNTGILKAQTLKHILSEVDRPEALSQEELEEFMTYAFEAKQGEWAERWIRVDDLLSKLIMGF